MLDNLNLVVYGPKMRIERKGLIFKKEVQKPATLSEYAENGDNREAYFMRFILNATVLDSCGRGGSMPYLTLVTGKELAEEIVSLLKQNPNQYNNLVRAILPREKFPKVNAGILDTMKELGGIVLLDMNKVPRESEESIAEKAKKYGEKVRLKKAG